ncbi:MAG: CBS domain-containing protein [Desulfobacterales bacterium]|jgi:tRNA nucleotidyltransferase (CCA-adding enzyme)|nr:CBS domain-containing protein [Desulfobacteraceae bacterium]MBT7086414.1 CBS domain-containing protein [Desulfobacterales bacterium]
MSQIITTHKNTDFDAFASLVAGTILYPDAIPVLPKNINPNVKAFISIHKDLFDIYSLSEISSENIEKLIVVDACSWDRLEKFDRFINKDDLEVVLWDHHMNGDIKPTWKCQEKMGATITLMLRHLIKEEKELTPIQATLFLAGLYEDTGCLTFQSTNSEDAYAAAYLLEKKADLKIVNTFLTPVYGEKQKDILFEMIKSSTRETINGYKVSFNQINIQGHIANLSVIVNMYREIVNVDAAFGIFKDDNQNKCMVIGRSGTEDINIGAIMRGLGGGGHPGAGSAMLKSEYINSDAIKETIKKLVAGSNHVSVHIRDIMSYPVLSVSSSTIMEKIAMILREKGCTGVPVIDEGEIVGVISRRDFRKITRESQLKSPVKAFMKRDVVDIESSRSIMDAARLMVNRDIGRLPVVDDGLIVGIITRSDVMSYLYDMLPG